METGNSQSGEGACQESQITPVPEKSSVLMSPLLCVHLPHRPLAFFVDKSLCWCLFSSFRTLHSSSPDSTSPFPRTVFKRGSVFLLISGACAQKSSQVIFRQSSVYARWSHR